MQREKLAMQPSAFRVRSNAHKQHPQQQVPTKKELLANAPYYDDNGANSSSKLNQRQSAAGHRGEHEESSDEDDYDSER